MVFTWVLGNWTAEIFKRNDQQVVVLLDDSTFVIAAPGAAD